ncbi:MAG: endonuclease [Ginsengibacter sp.]
MPEGPSIIIARELVQKFIGQNVISVEGNSKNDIHLCEGKKIDDIKSWGKHFLICFDDFTIKIHFMLFGSYSIDEKPEWKKIRLGLHFKNGSLYLFACSVQFIDEDLNKLYDWSGDVMNDKWNPVAAKRKLKIQPEILVCDALLDQNIFAGVGNIIKNEVCYRVRVHPESKWGKLPRHKGNQLIIEARKYSFDFLEWKKEYTLKKHWLAHTKKKCERCDLPIIKKYSGRTNRRTFFCTNCQVLYR